MQQAGFAPRVMEARPPYIRFEKRAIERRDTEGNVTYDDVDFGIITPQGSKDSVDKRMDEYLKQLRKDTKDGMFPISWLEAYEQSYQAWRMDQDPPVNGTAIKNWPAASPAEIKILTGLRIIAVEDLAQANEELMARIGMGARALKAKAQAWLEGKSDLAPLVSRLEAQAQTIGHLETRVKELESELMVARVQLKQANAPAPAGPGFIQADLETRLSDARDAAEASGPREADLINEALDDVLS